LRSLANRGLAMHCVACEASPRHVTL